MPAMTPDPLVLTFSRHSGDPRVAVVKLPNRTAVSAHPSGGDVPTIVTINSGPQHSRAHSAIEDASTDRKKMATILKNVKNKTIQINHAGANSPVKLQLSGSSSAMRESPKDQGRQHGYVITPAGASAGENISINGGGLLIRARNDKKQTITATSTPDNQLQVSVGQGKSAVQLSIQVTPQGKRGEVELKCVRNPKTEEGTETGYTVSVNSETGAEGNCTHERSASAAAPRAGLRERSRSPTERNKSTPEKSRSNGAAHQVHAPQPQGTEARVLRDEANEANRACPKWQSSGARYNATPRKARASQQKALDADCTKENYPDWFYKRKLDTHHHKPTISYLIGRRMTELFKEMRKTAELHPPAPPFIKF